ncbi:hypothetical protein SLS58_003228 [Diplodia intermedia]|uniref:Uncharacterized protein n=1 Tax=Diplodia intermedia TaxID=856260 RepID=A0ABR3TX97_9PEZI
MLKSGNQALHEQTERATLPSQIRNTSGTSSKVSRATKATIRSVTPEVFGKSLSKEMTGDGHQQRNDQDNMDRDSPDDDSDSGLVIPRIRLQRTAKATMPTPEQLSRRKWKTESRWQNQLHQGHSPVFSKNVKKAMAGTNPYELARHESSPSPSKSIAAPPRISSRKPQQPLDMLSPGWPSRADIMSPSVYSRDSTGESPLRKESEGSNCPPGTVVIVSSHSAKSYTLGSSPKKDGAPGPARSSKDWKKWLSKEVSELDLSQDFDMSMTEEWLLKPAGHQREHAEIVGVGDGDDEVVIFKSRPASHNFPNTRPERLTLIEPKQETVGPSDPPGTEEADSGHRATVVSSELPASEGERQTSLRGIKNGIRKTEIPADKHIGTDNNEPKSGNSPNTWESGRNTDRESESASASASPSEPEEKIPVSTLTDKRIRNSRSLQSVHRSLGRSHSSLAHYTTSAEDPVMQQRPTVPTYAAETASTANPPSLRHRPAAAAATAPFYRPRSAFDLRQHRSGDQLRPSAAHLHGGSPVAVPSPTGPTLLPPPPPHHHTHHLRRKPMAVGCRGRAGGHLTPSPTHNPPPGLQEGTDDMMMMHSIMQGPYGHNNNNSSRTNNAAGNIETASTTSSSTPPWVPPPPPPPAAELGRSSLAARQHWNNRGSPSPLALPATGGGGGSGSGLLTTRQSTPALRVTPKLGSMRISISIMAASKRMRHRLL